ncbi:PilZ domain-containing protein [Cohaesibacter haloalkalitolerans]|uniref:PilZ domain-containing protein n=1 Tax=Cohaesibacter haloalkalitolerans TaxID=1162980 RepID=UPI000E648480|nr:PilZ domain-containing protein [Cohaesibacter haloalkalitolerans]
MEEQQERRQDQRHRVFKGGKLFFRGFMVSTDCIIRNEAGSGMQLEVDPETILPPTLSLLDRKAGLLSKVRIVWRKGRRMGVATEGAPEDVRTTTQPHISNLMPLLRC